MRLYSVPRVLAGALALLLLSNAASAQQSPQRVRGTIERIDGPVLSVKTREGANLTIRLADNATIAAVVRAELSDIKAGAYIGVAAVPMQAGVLRALEVHIFPEGMRGTGEGHRPWDLLPESTMTNASVAETVNSIDGSMLTLKYKDGEQKIFVPGEAPIVTYVTGESAMI